jgi:spore maturation protein SpmA
VAFCVLGCFSGLGLEAFCLLFVWDGRVATFWVFVFIVGVVSAVVCFFGVANVYSSTCHVRFLLGLSWLGCGVLAFWVGLVGQRKKAGSYAS